VCNLCSYEHKLHTNGKNGKLGDLRCGLVRGVLFAEVIDLDY